MTQKGKKTDVKPSHKASNPVEMVTKYAVNGLYFGVGAAALVAENAQEFMKKAVHRGEQVDLLENLGKINRWQEKVSEQLGDFPQQPLKLFRSFVSETKKKDPMVVLEARLREEVLKATDRIQTPIKKNLQDLNKKVNNLSNLVSKMAAH
ncbi:MAG: hypothetical protein HYR55_20450 [Acidobacteria bacterium]|nr:hypothetical protein [Acidobacteriota bacterium]MBI3658081.1 hypothetical protein [Acidobacteriota bacterium]